MKLSCQLFANKFQASPESVFELPHVKKLLTHIVHNENDEHFYEVIKLKNFQPGKDSIKNNIVLYLSSIIFCFEERFGELIGDGKNVEIDTGVVDGDRILHNICTVLNIRNWMLSDGIPVNSDNVAVFYERSWKVLRSYLAALKKCFFKDQFQYQSRYYEKGIHKYHNIYSLNHLNPVVPDPRQFWKLLYGRRNTQTWNQAFLLLELCLYAPYSNATLEMFFSQMRVVKTNWRNRLNEENLTHLLTVKVDGPTIEKFHANYTGKVVTLWYNDRNRRMHQP